VTSADTGPLLPRRRLGAAFRELREARNETLQQTAKALMFSPSKLSRIENGLAGEPHPRDVRDLIRHFDVDGDAAAGLEELAAAGRRPGWWQVPPYSMPAALDTYISYESTATRIDHYSPTVVPGQLQIEDYARDTIARLVPHLSSAEVEHQVEIRMERKRHLRARQDPPAQRYVVPETILHRLVGSPATMSQQLSVLVEAADDPHVELHVIPFSAGIYEAVELSAVTIFGFAPPDGDVVVIERTRYVEFLDRPRTVQKYDEVFSRLPQYWLDQARSREFIEQVRRERWQDKR
jgi:transcriptional regulator with XRE-family HTH domain